MYYEYWGLKKAPFDNVPDPTMYAECHETMERSIAETLFAIEEGDDCISVIVGDVGLGKTLSIRMVIDSLNHEKYKIALVTNPGLTFTQLMKEIIGQITGKQCEENKKVDLLEIFNKLLFHTVDEGKKILIFIDEANILSAKNLENLRLLTNMQDDQRNLFTIILVGQMELAQRLELPKFANIYQRIGTYNRIEKIKSRDLVKEYVVTRLRLAGGTRNIFTDDVYDFIWEYSEHGVPRLINRICKLSLKAGETNEFSEINADVVRLIGERFRKMAIPADSSRKPRKRPMDMMAPESIEEIKPVMEKEDLLESSALSEDVKDEDGIVTEGVPEEKAEPVMENVDLLRTPAIFEDEKIAEDVKDEQIEPVMKGVDYEESATSVEEEPEEIQIGDNKVSVDIPNDFIEKAQASDKDGQAKMAGVMAAQTIKDNPELVESMAVDPVPVWDEIKNFILRRIGKGKK